MPDNTQAKPSIRPVGLLRGTTTVEQARAGYDAVDKLLAEKRVDPKSGTRPAHTSGVYIKGVFRPEPAGTDLCRSEIFKKDVAFVARFSNTSGRMGKRDLHGFAVRFIPGKDEATTDLVAINIDRFMFTRSDDFIGFLRDAKRGWRGLGGGGFRFLALTVARRASVRAMWLALTTLWRRPVSLQTLTYHGLHTFFVEDDKAKRIPFRYSLDPVVPSTDGPPAKNVRELYRGLIARVEPDSPIEFRLMFYLPWKSDQLSDWSAVPEGAKARLIKPTIKWRTGRKIEVGTLSLKQVIDAAAFTDGGVVDADLDHLVFDPTNLAEGIFPSEDETLRVRGGVYAESHMRRTS